jgi:hypothetical protein
MENTGPMGFRLKAFGLHLLTSATVLTVILGLLYWGWYHWPGWHLADVSHVVLVMVGVDVVVGPLLTFVIAKSSKPRRELTRDIAIIAFVQLCALSYGTVSLWHGRPLYYAFSENVLQMVQAYDISDDEWALGSQRQPDLAPHWYSLPRWIWAPLPADPKEREKIVTGAITGGDDVISMPRYFKPWNQGAQALRAQLKQVDKVGYFSPNQKKQLKGLMIAAGYSPDEANAIPLTGRGAPLLAVFEPAHLKLLATFAFKSP